MIHYYQEPNGDYLVVDTSPTMQCERPNIHESRAAAIAGLDNPVSTTGISDEFLATSIRLPRRKVPKNWLRWLTGGVR